MPEDDSFLRNYPFVSYVIKNLYMEEQNLNEYKVAIIIPAIKSKFLRKTLTSIFLQTLDNFHVYIGDDASKEDIQSILLDFPQEKITYKKFANNLGSIDLIAQWKRCIEMSTKEPWIWLFSDDDFMSPNCIERFVEFASHCKSDFYRFQTKKIDERDNIIQENVLPIKTKLDLFLNMKLSYRIESYAVECIFNRNLLGIFNQIPHTPLGWCFDDLLWINLLSYSSMYTIPTAWVYWRCSNLNISGGSDDKVSAIKKLEACSIYMREMQRLDLISKNESLFRYWILRQYVKKVIYIDSIDQIEEFYSKIPLLRCSSSEKYAIPATFEQVQCWNYHIQPKANISPQVLFFSYQLKVCSFEDADKVVNNLVLHNDSLRATFTKEADELMLVVSEFDPLKKYSYHCVYENREKYKESLNSFILRNEQSLDIKKDNTLVKIFIASVSGNEFYLHIFIHHLLCDEYSLSLLKKQLDSDFKIGVENQGNTIADYSLWQRRQWKHNSFTIKDYWEQKLSEAMSLSFSYTYHESGVKQYDRKVFWQLLENSRAELYRTSLTKDSVKALRNIQKKYTSSLLCVFFYAIRYLFFRYFACEKILLSSPLRNVTNRKFRETIGYLAGGLYSYDKFTKVGNFQNDMENYYFSLLQSMRFLISNHSFYGLDENELRLSNGLYVNIMPENYRVDIIEEDFVDKFVHVDNTSYYPLEVYIIEKENNVFIEYAFNKALYTEYDIKYFNNLINLSLLQIDNHD